MARYGLKHGEDGAATCTILSFSIRLRCVALLQLLLLPHVTSVDL
jgi:hypothetical protein